MRPNKFVLTIMLGLVSSSPSGQSFAQSLYTLPEGIETRWSTPENPNGEKGKGGQTNGGRKGRPAIPVKNGEQTTLAEIRGTSGMVRRIWATLSDRSPAMLRGLKLEMFWDGAGKPAVSVPFGDFFGAGLGRVTAFDSAFFGSPEGRSFNCYIPMPFRAGMKIVVTNESGRDLQFLFYEIDYTLGDQHRDNDLYFHAHFRRENPTKLQKDFEILPEVLGKGRFLGTSLGVQANGRLYFDKWWGEGEVKIYLDGDRQWPTLVGTGTEDYVGTGWGLNRFSNPYQGAPFADEKTRQYSFYRFHVPDPVYFRTSIRVTIQQIGYLPAGKPGDPVHKTGVPIYKTGPGLVEMEKGGSGTFEREDDWSGVAYFYLDKSEDNLPAIDPPAQRMKGMAWGGPYFAQ